MSSEVNSVSVTVLKSLKVLFVVLSNLIIAIVEVSTLNLCDLVISFFSFVIVCPQLVKQVVKKNVEIISCLAIVAVFF